MSGGIESVRVIDLARQLHVSKSGFYWHFKDRTDLLENMQRYWVDEFSREFIEEAQSRQGTLRERLVSLVEKIRAKDSGKLDLAFLSWAQTDPAVRALVDSVRDMRIEFVRDLLGQSGANDVELDARAKLFVVYFAWSAVMFEHRANGLAGEDLNVVLDIIVGDRLD